jgi:hypothetical protein
VEFYFAVLNATTRPCPTPTLATVTNPSYGTTIRANGTIIVWGLTSYGCNLLLLSNAQGEMAQMGEQDGEYFWDLSQDQINASLTHQAHSGTWQATVVNECGSRTSAFPITIN